MSDSPFTKYEDWLAADLSRGFEDAGRHFENGSRVHLTLRKLAKHLDELGIPYAVAGDMAMFFHGYRRFAETLEILVRHDDFYAIVRQRETRGYELDSPSRMDLRDREFGVLIRFICAGTPDLSELPLPVEYPDPSQVAVEIGGLKVIALPALIEIKLAFGMKGPRYLQHLSDVQSLIDRLSLPREFGDRLDPLVQGKYREMWMDVQNDPMRWRY